METEDNLQKVINFLQTYPKLGLSDNIVVVPFDPSQKVANGIASIGTQTVSITKDVIGNNIITLQDNFIVTIQRQLVDEIKNKELAIFIKDYVRWILLQNLKGKTPKFGNNPDYSEQFVTNNDFLAYTDLELRIAQYQFQIAVTYQLFYSQEDLLNLKEEL